MDFLVKNSQIPNGQFYLLLKPLLESTTHFPSSYLVFLLSVTHLIFELSAPRFTLYLHLLLFWGAHLLALPGNLYVTQIHPISTQHVHLESFFNRAKVSFTDLPIVTQNVMLIHYSSLLSFIFYQRYSMNTCNFLYCSVRNNSSGFRFMKVGTCGDVLIYKCSPESLRYRYNMLIPGILFSSPLTLTCK